MRRHRRPRTEWRVLRNYRGWLDDRFWMRDGRDVLIEAPGREAVEVYREQPDGLEMFVGYLGDLPQRQRIALLAKWTRGLERAGRIGKPVRLSLRPAKRVLVRDAGIVS